MKNQLHADWIARWFAPLWGSNCTAEQHGCPEVILAPNLEGGFYLARSFWPTAKGWVCLGKQDPKDPEGCIE